MPTIHATLQDIITGAILDPRYATAVRSAARGYNMPDDVTLLDAIRCLQDRASVAGELGVIQSVERCLGR